MHDTARISYGPKENDLTPLLFQSGVFSFIQVKENNNNDNDDDDDDDDDVDDNAVLLSL